MAGGARFGILLVAPAVVLALFLRLLRLDRTGQNLYYAAGVRSMLDSWHNFFYVSFDPGGALTIDKPPLGFWLQATAARALGFHYWVLAIPQVIAGVASVAILFLMVRPRYGLAVASVSALVLAVIPASVASSRNNSLDTIAMLFMLLSAWMVLKAGELKSFRYLAMSALFAGLAFNTKMFAAFIPVPAFALSYFVAYRPEWRRAAGKLMLAFVLLSAVSLSWVSAVAVTPSDSRPHIYNGFGDSIWALTFRYNGINRVIGSQLQARVRAPSSQQSDQNLGSASRAPTPGPQRLLVGRMGSQLGWFLPLACIAWITRTTVWRRPFWRPPTAADALFSAWFFSGLALFSVNADIKPQYLEAFVAPIALGAGIALCRLGSSVREGSRLAIALLAALVVYHASLLATVDDTRVAAGAIIGLGVGSSGLWLATRLGWGSLRVRQATAVGVGMTLLMGPLVWSLMTALAPATGSGARYPTAGPEDVRDYPPAPGGDFPTRSNSAGDAVLAFLERNTGGVYYMVATERSLYGNAARYILVANRPVLTLDSYSHQSEAAASLAQLVDEGRLRFLELPPEGPWLDAKLDLGRWFLSNCHDVTSGDLQPIGGVHLYDCRPRGSIQP